VATLGIESVSVGYQPKACRTIKVPKSKSPGAEVIVDGYAHPSEGGEVKEGPSWCGKVEVQKGNSFTIPEDDVLKTHIVMADHCPAAGISQLVAPLGWDDGQLGRSLVERPDQGGDRRECVVTLYPGWKWRDPNVPSDEEQPFPPVLLDLDWYRSSLESSRSEPEQEGMHGLGVGIRGAKDELTPSDDTSSICYSTRQDLVHGTSLSKDCPPTGQGEHYGHLWTVVDAKGDSLRSKQVAGLVENLDRGTRGMSPSESSVVLNESLRSQATRKRGLECCPVTAGRWITRTATDEAGWVVGDLYSAVISYYPQGNPAACCFCNGQWDLDPVSQAVRCLERILMRLSCLT
jgi:hypothetical protein